MNNYNYIPDEIPTEFWGIMDRLTTNPADWKSVFVSIDKQALIRFAWNYEEAAAQLKPEFETEDDFSEDSLDELCNWIVAQGKSFYKKIWDDPSQINVSSNHGDIEYHSDPGIYSSALETYKHQFNEELPFNKSGGFVL